ncbi:MAG: hypothetical protein ACRYF3_16235 [Janthinobacterium lividum]
MTGEDRSVATLGETWRRMRPPRRLLHLDSAAAGRSSWAVLDAVTAHAQGHGKVAFQQVRSSARDAPGLRAWWRKPEAMFTQPSSRSRLIAVLRRVAMTWGPLPVRTWERSSSNVTSRTRAP